MRRPGAPLVLSERIAGDARRFLDVIDNVLVLDYLNPDLRRRVIRFQKVLIRAELAAQAQGQAMVTPLEADPARDS